MLVKVQVDTLISRRRWGEEGLRERPHGEQHPSRQRQLGKPPWAVRRISVSRQESSWAEGYCTPRPSQSQGPADSSLCLELGWPWGLLGEQFLGGDRVRKQNLED